MAHVIKDHERVVEGEQGSGQVEWICVRKRYRRLEASGRLVGQIADRAAGEAWQAGHARHRSPFQLGPHGCEWVSADRRVRRFPPFSPRNHLYSASSPRTRSTR